MYCRLDELLSFLAISRTVGGDAATAIPPSGLPYSSLFYFRRISRCPWTSKPRSASRRSHPARVPLVAVSSSSP